MGELPAARYLVDGFCLGVKYCEGFAIYRSGLDDLIVQIKEKEDMRVVAPSAARKLIESAVQYAEQLGFDPHANYGKMETIWTGVESSECLTEFEWGKDGQPFYLCSVDDSPVTQANILKKLDAAVGEGNYGFAYDESVLNDESEFSAYDDPELDADIDEDVIDPMESIINREIVSSALEQADSDGEK